MPTVATITALGAGYGMNGGTVTASGAGFALEFVQAGFGAVAYAVAAGPDDPGLILKEYWPPESYAFAPN